MRLFNLKTIHIDKFESESESFSKLLQAMQNDPVINIKVINILKMDSYPRRLVLNNWLEQLRRNHAPQKLLRSLACLFDDIIAEMVLSVINNRVNKKNGQKNNC